ncbi:uncharacterized protein J3R85_004790 [Psidium guajava]|nr:uncharacterized protein J3R85_004790 [Psidium guajava]
MSHCQQPFAGSEQVNCSSTLPQLKGYLCNGPQTQCQSFLMFRSTSQYSSPLTIASLLSSDALDIATINNASYTVAKGDTYFNLANITFQGLSSCQALINQNYYNGEDLAVDAQLGVPLRCACPSTNDTANGVESLLTYLVTHGDSIDSIAERYGVTAQRVMEANMMTDTSVVFPFTPILIPLSCAKNSKSSFCYCPNGFAKDVSRNGLNCMPHQKKFPFKLVLVIGSHEFSANSVQQHFMPVARGYPLRSTISGSNHGS